MASEVVGSGVSKESSKYLRSVDSDSHIVFG